MFDNRTINYAMHMYGDEALKLVEKAAEILNTKGFKVTLRKELRRGTGSTDLKENETLVYEVGIKEIAENPNRSFPIHEAISPVVTCFHEVCGHGGQWRHEAYKDTPLSKILLMNDLACRNSWQYYGMDEYGEPTRQYFDQPHEIAAQYMALKMTHKYLSAVYGEEKATAMVTEYVNIRMGKEQEYVIMPDEVKMTPSADHRGPFVMPTEPYKDMPEVLDNFQDTFVQKVFETPEYKVPRDMSDFVGTYINKHDWPWKRQAHREQIENIQDRLTKTYVAASAWLNQKEEYCWMKECPCFHNVEFPRKVSEILNVNIKLPNKADLDLSQLTEDDIDFTKAVKNIALQNGGRER